MRIRPRFLVMMALAGALFYWHISVPEDGYRSRCTVRVSWEQGLDNQVPMVMDEINNYSGIKWVPAPQGGDIRFVYGPLPEMVLGEATISHYGPYIREVTVTLRNDEAVTYATLLHEAAHAIGIRHNGNTESYMNAYNYPNQRVTPEDIEDLRAAGERCY